MSWRFDSETQTATPCVQPGLWPASFACVQWLQGRRTLRTNDKAQLLPLGLAGLWVHLPRPSRSATWQCRWWPGEFHPPEWLLSRATARTHLESGQGSDRDTSLEHVNKLYPSIGRGRGIDKEKPQKRPMKISNYGDRVLCSWQVHWGKTNKKTKGVTSGINQI